MNYIPGMDRSEIIPRQTMSSPFLDANSDNQTNYMVWNKKGVY